MNAPSIVPAATDTFDAEYHFGQPASQYLSPVVEARLAILRTRIDDACHHIGRRSLQAKVIESGIRRAGITNGGS